MYLYYMVLSYMPFCSRFQYSMDIEFKLKMYEISQLNPTCCIGKTILGGIYSMDI